MVEAIEDLFVPVLVYNNKSSDSALLKKFNEPSWNNPIVRFLNGSGSDLIPRKSGVWTIGPMAARMVATLKAANREVPSYLSNLAIDPSSLETATFAMSCYWTGEARLGAIDGVMTTTAGWTGFRGRSVKLRSKSGKVFEVGRNGSNDAVCDEGFYSFRFATQNG